MLKARYGFIFFLIVTLTANLYAMKETDNGLKKVTLQLQWLHQFQFAGYYMAKEKGFYKKAGLDVTIREYKAHTDVVTDVLEERAEFGVGRSSLITERMRDRPVVALGAIFQSSPHVLLVTKASGIKKAKDLKDKRIMITEDAFSSASVLAMLSNQGINKSDIHLQPHSFDIHDLVDGKTDAMASYISNEPFLLESLGVPYRILKPQDYGFDFYSDIFFTSEKFLEKDPEAVRAFYAATIEGWRHAFAHIDESVALILEKYNTQHKSKEALIYEARKLKELTYDKDKTVPLGHIDANKIKRIADIYMVLGELDKDYSLDGFIYEVHLHKESALKLTKEEKAWLAAHPHIRVGIDVGWPPFEYVTESGEYKGMAAEYMDIIQKKLGVTFLVEKNLSWADVVQNMKDRKLDLYSCVVKSKERDSYMNFTTPYLSFPMVIISNDSINYIDGLKELEGKKVAVVKGYITEELLKRNHPKIELVPLKNVQEALEMVAFKKVYAYVGNIATASYYIKKLGFTNIKVAGETPYRFELSMAGRDDWPILTKIMQKTMDSISQDEKDRIYKNWIAISYEHAFDYSLFWKVMGGILVVLILVGFWVRLLLKQIGLRKEAEARLNELNHTLEAEVKAKVDELREKDKILMQQSKMAAMGEMISIIAHQLKQPLNVIGLIAQDIKESYEYKELDTQSVTRFSDAIQTNVQYMAGTVDDFRNFFNPNKQKKNFDIKELLEKTAELMKVQFQKYKIHFEIESVHENIFGVSNELQQIIINLANNAKDAFIERNISERVITIKAYHSENRNNLFIDFYDTAGGIDTAIIDKIFDSYFSTKGEEGTGIGLHMVRMMLRESFHGQILVSNTDNGALFRIKLPLKQGE